MQTKWKINGKQISKDSLLLKVQGGGSAKTFDSNLPKLRTIVFQQSNLPTWTFQYNVHLFTEFGVVQRMGTLQKNNNLTTVSICLLGATIPQRIYLSKHNVDFSTKPPLFKHCFVQNIHIFKYKCQKLVLQVCSWFKCS